MSNKYACPQSDFPLFSGVYLSGNIAGQSCSIQKCGQLSSCFKFNSAQNTTAPYVPQTSGCCRRPLLYANAFSVFVYILLLPIIGIGILGGLGGGVVKRPLLEAMLNYNSTDAGNITSCLMFASALTNLIILFFQKHPEANERPMINFEIAVVYCLGIPYSLSIGETLSDYLSDLTLLAIQILFFAVLCAILLYFASKEKSLEIKKKEDSNLLQSSQLIPPGNIQGDETQALLYKQLCKDASDPFPIISMLIIFGNFAINEVASLMRSTVDQQSPIFPDLKICTGWDYYIILIMLPIDFAIVILVLWYQRKRELLKEQLNFLKSERYYTPISRFFIIYACGCATGFAAGLMGIAAGLIMVTTMSEFGLMARVAGSTANFCYFIITLNLFGSMLVNGQLTVGPQFLFYVIGALGVLAFTFPAYQQMSKYNIGYILFYFDFGLCILNIIGNIAQGLEEGYRFGFETLISNIDTCTYKYQE